MRFLSKVRRNRRAIVKRIDVLLSAWEETPIIETAFDNAGRDAFEFIRLLKLTAAGHEELGKQLQEIAAAVAPNLRVRRGPKVSAASAAHEFFLETAVSSMEPRAYTWNDLEAQFTDAATAATCLEFGCSDFSPQPARRRLKARLLKSS